MIALSNLSSSGKKRKRIGRGGNRGGTSGRGSKGQKARSGPTLGLVFEGGQMPLSRRLPKRGFSNARFKQLYEIINLDDLNRLFEQGTEITLELLAAHGLISDKNKSKVKILGDGLIEKQLIVHAHACSQKAEKAIKSRGGEVRLTKEM
ncbi:MAG TPA: 50S ribosomal protein L15 [Candidatus Babeliaceae bacterium]|nr:50S ribosomal protein L15 [Candidatus Babeliaceae bacterium]